MTAVKKIDEKPEIFTKKEKAQGDFSPPSQEHPRRGEH
jgi:hypothetical protein